MSFKFFSGFNNKRGSVKEDMVAVGSASDNTENEVLKKCNIKLNLPSVNKYEAIRMAGRLLVESGCVDESYIEAMIEREDDLTTYIGCGVAIPHGVGRAKNFIKKSGIVVLQFPEGVDFGEEKAYLVIGIAGVGEEHMDILSNIATVIGDEDEEKLNKLKTTKDVNYIYETFTAN
ncbi:PTS sugar transporter subunit IIA [Clostridium swellfunianum]|uniref:PTS sugar transporter subunit IIA n=1 Tax=Clostridium swellfunianum TaxID=1367462 RepID=UPI0020307459|nr:PTS sugar transporter subunit IIA [Clostridium swellfunianum]MCM0647496.1 PTS sugar transporter subunit IIA [Clostridium swellfunianum]